MSQHNEKRPGYKKTKAGWIPDEWEFGKFSDVADIIMGQSPDGKSYNKNKLGIPLINGPKEFTKRYPIKKQWTSSPTKICQFGDVLLCVRGSSTGRINIADDTYCIGRGIAAIREKKSQSYASFIEHLMSDLNSQILMCTVGSTFPNIDKKTLSNISIAIPPFPEQKKIAEILSTWDEAIEQTRKLIDAKKRRKKALMQQLLTGKKRLPGFNESWEEYRLGELFDERREVNCNHLPLLAITGTRGVIPATEIKRKDSSSVDKSRYKRIVSGDIGYNTMRMWQGVSAVSDLEGIVSPAYTICIPKETVDVRFMGYFFKFSPVVNLFRRFSQGLVNDTLNLKFHNFAQIKIKMPCLGEQHKIAIIFQVADEEIEILQNKLVAIEKQKRGLMQKLLTGEVRAVV